MYKKGFTVKYTVPSGVILAQNSPVIMGSLFGIATSTGVAGDEIIVSLKGVYSLAKAAEAVTLGQKLYYDTENENITAVATGNTFAGYAYEAAGEDDPMVYILIGYTDPGTFDVAASVAAITAVPLTEVTEATALTAVPETFADLAAVRSHLATLQTEIEARQDAYEAYLAALAGELGTRLAAIETALNGLISSLTTAQIMAVAEPQK